MPETWIPKLLYQHEPKGRSQGRPTERRGSLICDVDGDDNDEVRNVIFNFSSVLH
jgi:hypothetical protein